MLKKLSARGIRNACVLIAPTLRSVLQAWICANGCASAYSVAKRSPPNPPTSPFQPPCSRHILTPSPEKLQRTKRKASNRKHRPSRKVQRFHRMATQTPCRPSHNQRSPAMRNRNPHPDLQGNPPPGKAPQHKPIALAAVAAVADAAPVAASKPSPKLSLPPRSKDQFRWRLRNPKKSLPSPPSRNSENHSLQNQRDPRKLSGLLILRRFSQRLRRAHQKASSF